MNRPSSSLISQVGAQTGRASQAKGGTAELVTITGADPGVAMDSTAVGEPPGPGRQEHCLKAHILAGRKAVDRDPRPGASVEATSEPTGDETNDTDRPSALPLSGLPVPHAAVPPADPIPAGPNLQLAEALQQVVEFAGIHRNREGHVEFMLGLLPGVVGGLRMRVIAYGNRRIGLRYRGGGAVPICTLESELGALAAELRKHGLDVVEIVPDR